MKTARTARGAAPGGSRRSPARRARSVTFLGAVKAMPFPGRVVKSGEPDAATVLAVQQRLNAVGCGRVDEDGVFGPQTSAAVRLFQARFPDADRQPLKIDGLVGAVTWAALFGREAVPRVDKPAGPLLKSVLEVAASQVGVMEKPPGSNRGPEVAAYLSSVGLAPGNAWCAAFVYFCFQGAAKRLGRPNPAVRTGGVLEHWGQAVKRGIPTISAAKAHIQEELVRPGHVFIIDTGAPGGEGHTGIVEAVVAGKLVTIEGNTNDGGGREGVGVFRRESRRVRDVNVGFIDYGAA